MAISYLLLIDFKACPHCHEFSKVLSDIKGTIKLSIYHVNLEMGHFSRFRTFFYCLEIKNQTKKKLVVSCICNINLFEREFYHAKVSKTKRTRNETING
jgi:hypothetical protein